MQHPMTATTRRTEQWCAGWHPKEARDWGRRLTVSSKFTVTNSWDTIHPSAPCKMISSISPTSADFQQWDKRCWRCRELSGLGQKQWPEWEHCSPRSCHLPQRRRWRSLGRTYKTWNYSLTNRQQQTHHQYQNYSEEPSLSGMTQYSTKIQNSVKNNGNGNGKFHYYSPWFQSQTLVI